MNLRKKAGKVYDSAKGMINEIPVKGYQEKAKQAINSAKKQLVKFQLMNLRERLGKLMIQPKE